MCIYSFRWGGALGLAERELALSRSHFRTHIYTHTRRAHSARFLLQNCAAADSSRRLSPPRDTTHTPSARAPAENRAPCHHRYSLSLSLSLSLSRALSLALSLSLSLSLCPSLSLTLESPSSSLLLSTLTLIHTLYSRRGSAHSCLSLLHFRASAREIWPRREPRRRARLLYLVAPLDRDDAAPLVRVLPDFTFIRRIVHTQARARASDSTSFVFVARNERRGGGEHACAREVGRWWIYDDVTSSDEF